MLRFENRIPAAQAEGKTVDETVRLPHALRERSRQRILLPSGREAGLFLPRGTVLHDGDVLVSEAGALVRVRAAAEALSRVRCPSARDMARICCHLGNRHAPLEIGPDFVQFQRDHVFDALMARLGFPVEHLEGPFEPEPGAVPVAQAAPGGIRIVARR